MLRAPAVRRIGYTRVEKATLATTSDRDRAVGSQRFTKNDTSTFKA